MTTDDFAEGLAAFTGRRPPAFTGQEKRIHPVQLVVADDLRRWRLTVIFRWVLVIPHLAVAIAWASLVAIVWPVLWVLALVRGQVPAGLHATP